MKKFISFPSIEQFRNIIKDVQHSAQFQGMDTDNQPIYDRNAILPKLTFTGTVKLHGTNAGVCYFEVNDLSGESNARGEFWAQSRNNIITPENDNAGFAFFAHSKKEIFISMFKDVSKHFNIDLSKNTVSIYGEWCGGNIQKGVALTGLDKMFVIFGLKVSPHDGTSAYWLDEGFDKEVAHGNVLALYSPHNDIYNSNAFKMFTLEIDFNNPQLIQNELISLTEEVENECPVGKEFGNIGVGEGIVWKYRNKDGSQYIFKVKGEKHSSSKVKKLVSVDVEKLNSINEFVDYALTENRLNQGIEYVFTQQGREVDVKLTGDFLKWIVNDIIKEETDTLIENKLEPKDIGSAVSKKAREWFMKYIG